jgi:uncharacterized membrane protein YidH (DUF202 family)
MPRADDSPSGTGAAEEPEDREEPGEPEEDGLRAQGIARERTELSWNRTGLAAAAAIVVMLRHLWPLHGAGSAVALALVAAGAVAWSRGMAMAWRGADRATGGPTDPSTFRMLSLGTFILALVAFVIGALMPG